MTLSLPLGPTLTLPTALEDPHLWVLAVGLALAFAGGRLYRLAIVGPGIALGAASGFELAGLVGLDARMVAAVCLGILGGALFHVLERLAIAVTGAALVAGLANVGAALLLGAAAPWYVPAAGAVVGLLLFPSVYKRLLGVVTAVLGGLCTAWALGQPDDLRVVGVVAVLGMVVQAAVGARKRRRDQED